MSQNPDQLSQLLLEADGLLLLLQRHRDQTPIDAIKLLRKKLELIMSLTDGLDDEDEDPIDHIEPEESEPNSEPGPEQHSIDDTADVPTDASITSSHDYTPNIVNNEADLSANYHHVYTIDNSIDNTLAKNDQATNRRHLSSVLNLNDKFRFRRELFGNSDAQYVECLDMLSAMSSIDEAREYLLDDLKWDERNDDVADFISILLDYYNVR